MVVRKNLYSWLKIVSFRHYKRANFCKKSFNKMPFFSSVIRGDLMFTVKTHSVIRTGSLICMQITTQCLYNSKKFVHTCSCWAYIWKVIRTEQCTSLFPVKRICVRPLTSFCCCLMYLLYYCITFILLNFYFFLEITCVRSLTSQFILRYPL